MSTNQKKQGVSININSRQRRVRWCKVEGRVLVVVAIDVHKPQRILPDFTRDAFSPLGVSQYRQGNARIALQELRHDHPVYVSEDIFPWSSGNLYRKEFRGVLVDDCF